MSSPDFSIPVPEGLTADPRDFGQSDIREIRAHLEDESGWGLWLFAVHVCGLTKLTPHLHMEMCEFLSRWGKPGWMRLMMMVPRGSYKTSLGSKALPLWIATKDPTQCIGIFNAAQDQAKSWIGSIRTILEASKLYHTLWPERLPPGIHWKERDAGRNVPRSWKWGDSGLNLVGKPEHRSECTFEPYGIGGSSTGRHFEKRIMDDLIGETSVGSPAMIEDAINFVDHARDLEQPPNGGAELVNCTPWAYRDCYTHLLSKWGDEYKVYRRSLLENERGEPDIVNGESIFPESISTAQAKRMYENDPYVFSSQQQCIPMAGKEIAFQKEWVRAFHVELSASGEPTLRIAREHYDPTRVHAAVAGEEAPNLIPLHWCARAIMIDPAPSKRAERNQEPRARNGIVVLALDPWGRRFTLADCPLREDPVVVLEHVVNLAKEWRVSRIGIEEVNFSAVYAPLWQAILRSRYPEMEISFVPLMTKGEDKDTRIASMKGPHREGLWYYNLDRCGYVLQELLEYPNSETRDLIDAQAYQPQILHRPATPDEQSKTYYSFQESGRDPHTHY